MSGGKDEADYSEGMDVAAAYHAKCVELGVRVNSAVYARLEAASFRPITHLDLSRNYVGPKGIAPILHLLELHQTVEYLNLSHNGLDNAAASDLIRIAKDHKGLTEVDLSYNSITQVMGKALLGLLEANPRIVEFHLEGNDLYDALIRRAQLAVNYNREVQNMQPHIVPTRPVRRTEALGGSALRSPTRKESSGSPAKASASPDRPTKATVAQPLHDFPVHPHKVKPCPTPPAMASQGFRRMTPQEREAAQESYRRRLQNQSAQLSDCLVTTGITPANEAKRKLLLLEAQQQAYEDNMAVANSNLSQAAQLRLMASREDEAISDRVRAVTTADDKGEDALVIELSTEARAAISVQHDKVVKAETAIAEEERKKAEVASVQQEYEKLRRGQEELGEAELLGSQQTDMLSSLRTSTPPVNDEGKPTPPSPPSTANTARLNGIIARGEEADRRAAEKIEEHMQRQEDAKHLPLATKVSDHTPPEGLDTNGVKFFTLFQAGGEEYNNKNMSGAYEKWSEALEVATVSKNSEWISLVHGNILALSFEMLLAQYEEQVRERKPEEALETLKLASQVACNTRNPAWQRTVEMHMNTIRRSQIKECYDAAAAVFDPLIRELEAEVLERLQADHPVEERQRHQHQCTDPGYHTPAFTRECARLERLAQALSGWYSALCYSEKLSSGRDAEEFREMISDAVAVAYNYQCALTLSPDLDSRPRHAAQKTWQYSCKERAELVKRWGKIKGIAESLESPSWVALTANIIGNLEYAMNRNQPAIASFTESLEFGAADGNKVLLATTKSQLGRVYLQCARYSEGERVLTEAVNMWYAFRFDPEAVPSAVNPTYLVQQHVAALRLLQQIMLETHRYKAALEIAERMRNYTHHDHLQRKMGANFDTNTTTDHISAISRAVHSVLVIYSTVIRYEWNVDTEVADGFEQLAIWVVTVEGDFKFVLVEVTREHKLSSLEILVDRLVTALGVETDRSLRSRGEPASNKVITKVPEYTWKHVLQKLYDFLIYPIADLLTVSATTEFGGNNCKVTFVPHGYMHMVPWCALMDADGRYLAESYIIQVAHSVRVLSMALLNGTKLRTEGIGSDKLYVLKAMETRNQEYPAAFETELPDDSVAIAGNLATSPLCGRREDILPLLPSARLIHVSGEVYSDYVTGALWGGFATSDDGGLVTSADLEGLPLHAELAVLQNCNHSKLALSQGGDGTVGLVRALHGAGVPTVLHSLWAVPCITTGPLLLDFYQLLREQPDKALALTLAQRSLIKDDPHNPLAWASFVLTGVSTI